MKRSTASARKARCRSIGEIALAEQALGRWVDAERDLRAALDAAEDPWISGHHEALQGALDAIGKHLATLTVKANTSTGQVRLNGTTVGDLPMASVRVPAGMVRVEVRSNGYQPALRAMDLAPGADVTEEFRLTPIAELTPPPEPDKVRAAEPPPRVVMVPTPEPRADAIRRAFAWGTLGATGAFLGAAITAQIIREGKVNDYNDDSRCLYGVLSRDERCGIYRGQADSAQRLANFAFVGAGVLGVASAVLFLSMPTKTSPAVSSFSLGVQPTGAELTFTGKL